MHAAVARISSFPRRGGAGFGTWSRGVLRGGCRDIIGPVPPSLLIRLKGDFARGVGAVKGSFGNRFERIAPAGCPTFRTQSQHKGPRHHENPALTPHRGDAGHSAPSGRHHRHLHGPLGLERRLHRQPGDRQLRPRGSHQLECQALHHRQGLQRLERKRLRNHRGIRDPSGNMDRDHSGQRLRFDRLSV